MKKVLIVMFIVMMVVGVSWAIKLEDGTKLTGKHYNLNIIGAPKDKNGDASGWDNPKRHTIMVERGEKCNIYMTQGEEFAVIDGDGTDKRAEFQLAPGRYEVYAVALGKPNKSVTITPDAEIDGQTAEEVFYLGSITLEHNKKPKWERITGMFLVTVTVWVDANENGIVDPGEVTTYNNEWIFDIPTLVNYWWEYDNTNECRLTQIRFYEVDEIPEEGTVNP